MALGGQHRRVSKQVLNRAYVGALLEQDGGGAARATCGTCTLDGIKPTDSILFAHSILWYVLRLGVPK